MPTGNGPPGVIVGAGILVMVGVRGNEAVAVGMRVATLRILTGIDVSVAGITFDTGDASRSQALAGPTIKIIAMISVLYFISYLLLETTGFAYQWLAAIVFIMINSYLFFVF